MWADLRRVRVGTVAAAAVVLLGVAACGSDSPQGAPLPPKASATSPSPSPSSETEKILAQYRAFWKALPQASAAPASQRRRILAPFVTGDEFDQAVAALAKQDRNNQALYGENAPRARVTSLEENKATVVDCQDSSHTGVRDLSTGKALTVGVARNLVISTMRRSGADEPWKISSGKYQNKKC